MAFKTKIFSSTVATGITNQFTFDTDAIIVGIFSNNVSVYVNIQDGIGGSYAVVLQNKTPVLSGTAITAQFSASGSFSITYWYDDSVSDALTLIPAGTWSSTTTYAKNSIVYYSTTQLSYICNVSNLNKPPSTNTDIWQIAIGSGLSLNVGLSNELVSNTTGYLTGSTTSLSIATTLTNKTLTGARFTSNQFLDSTGTYTITIPSGISDTLATLTTTQTLSNKTLSSCTLSNPTITNSSITLSNSTITSGAGTYIKDTVTSSTSVTNYTISPASGSIFKLTTSATAGTTITITMPSPSSYSGSSYLIFITTGAATQTLVFSNSVKTPGTFAISQTGGVTDIYTAISDGTNWYISQVDKGFS